MTEAKAAGWSFRKASGHSFGTIRCPAGDDACRAVVWSSSGAEDGSDTAKAIRRALRACGHGAADGSTSDAVVDEPSRSDEEIERTVMNLLEAADRLIRRLETEVAVAAAVDEGDDDSFDEADRDHVAADNAAMAAVARVGRSVDPWPPEEGIGALLVEARGIASEANHPGLRARLLRAIRHRDGWRVVN